MHYESNCNGSTSIGATVAIIIIILIVLILILIGIGYIVKSSNTFTDVTATRRMCLVAGETKSIVTLRPNEFLQKVIGRPSSSGVLTFGFNDGVNYSEEVINVEENKIFLLDRNADLVLNRTEVTVTSDVNMTLHLGLYIDRYCV